MQIDFGVGDAVHPSPQKIDYPVLLGGTPLRLSAYPVEAAIAEKFHAMVELDLQNSRMKDFYDIWILSRTLAFSGSTLSQAISATFARRQTPIPTESPTAFGTAFYADSTHIRQWSAFVRRIGESALVGQLDAVITAVEAFLMPPSKSAALSRDYPARWAPLGPWHHE